MRSAREYHTAAPLSQISDYLYQVLFSRNPYWDFQQRFFHISQLNCMQAKYTQENNQLKSELAQIMNMVEVLTAKCQMNTKQQIQTTPMELIALQNAQAVLIQAKQEALITAQNNQKLEIENQQLQNEVFALSSRVQEAEYMNLRRSSTISTQLHKQSFDTETIRQENDDFY